MGETSAPARKPDKSVAWVCPRNGFPLHFELMPAKTPQPVPRQVKCPACGDDHWAAAQALLGDLTSWDLLLAFGRGTDW